MGKSNEVLINRYKKKLCTIGPFKTKRTFRQISRGKHTKMAVYMYRYMWNMYKTEVKRGTGHQAKMGKKKRRPQSYIDETKFKKGKKKGT